MDELYFLGMNIVEETKDLMNLMTITATNGMTEDELKSYRLGVENTISALQTILHSDCAAVINIDEMDIPTELSIDDVADYYETSY